MFTDSDGDASRSVVQSVVASLSAIDRLERIWTRGIVHRGGPHYRLAGTIGPVSIGEDECLLLGSLIAHFKPSTCFSVGNGFGLSSSFIGKMMERYGGTSVITLDDMSEGDGQRCFATAQELTRRLDCRIVRNKYGSSPHDIGRSAESAVYDFVFLDGNHAHPHATDDCRGLRPLLHQRSIMCWHDYWLGGVSASVADAERAGFHCLKMNSSSEMVFGTKDESVLREIRALFHDGEPPIRRRHPLARLTLSRSFVWGSLKARFSAT